MVFVNKEEKVLGMRETDFKEYKEIGEVLLMLDEVWSMV